MYVKNEIIELVRNKYHIKSNDPLAKLRIMEVFSGFNPFLRQHKVISLIFYNPNIAKVTCQRFRPPSFSKIVKNGLNVQESKLRNSWNGFDQDIIENSVE